MDEERKEAFQRIETNSSKSGLPENKMYGAYPMAETKKDSAAAFVFLEKTEEKEGLSYSAFAEGLPEWTIEPPQVMVRRHLGKCR